MRPFTIALSAALVLATALAPASEEGGDSTVAAWAEQLRTAQSARDRETALTALRTIAAGPTEVPRTREAVFELADAGLEEGTGRNGGRDLDALVKATTLYPDDPRTPGLLRALAAAQLEAADFFGAHLVFRKLIPDEDRPADLLPVAANNAARVLDMAAAFEWSRSASRDALPREEGNLLDSALLISAAALGRHELALEAYRRLEENDPQGLRVDAQKLGAAARTLEDLGLAEDAIGAYTTFVNVHPKAPECAESLLALGRLLARTERTTSAREYFDWLLRDHPHSRAAQGARLDLLQLDGEPGDLSKIGGYVEAIRDAADTGGAVEACRRFSEVFVGSGHPMELVDTIVSLAREGYGDDDGLTAMVAVQCLRDVIDPVLELLAARDDVVGVAAVAAAAESVGVEVPRARADVVARARRALGLPGTATPLIEAIAAAESGGPDADWEMAVERLLTMLDSDAGSSPETIAEAKRWIGEGLWRLDRADEAQAVLEEALALSTTDVGRRSIEVLLADVMFTTGDIESACAHYRKAHRTRRTPWVDRQVERCEGRRS